MSKIYSNFDEAVADVFDGATILVGGAQGPVGWPRHLLLALQKQGAKNLTVIGSSGLGARAGTLFRYPGGFIDAGILLESKQVKKAIFPFPYVAGRPGPIDEMYERGEVELEVLGHGTLVTRIWAGGAGIGGFYTPVGVGTVMEKGKEKKVIDGKEYLLELPLKADFTLIWAYKADKTGNLVYWGAGRQYNPVMATAAKVTIVEVEQIVEPGELDPECIVTPGIYVHRIVEIPEKERWVQPIEARRRK